MTIPTTRAVKATRARPTFRIRGSFGRAALARASSSVCMKTPVITGLMIRATTSDDVSVTMSVSGR